MVIRHISSKFTATRSSYLLAHSRRKTMPSFFSPSETRVCVCDVGRIKRNLLFVAQGREEN